ncbi:MAG: redox-regulated ATPase YchF [Candidatus Pacebacteria bacterium]|nr:redox-regulated ATPase YchF [Candidatus Paceibacterota bacterium]
MSLSIGIVGLPNVGKSTLFNALLKQQAALAANYPFATIEPNVGIVPVPDYRLDKLQELVGTNVRKPATVEFVDIAGLVKGASSGEGLGNKFLANIREASAIVHVLRAFEDEEIIREGSKNPVEDLDVIRTELQLADLTTLEKQRQPKGKIEKEEALRWEIVQLFKERLDRGENIRNSGVADLSEDEQRITQDLGLLTAKRELFVLNVSEETLLGSSIGELTKKFSDQLAVPIQSVIVMCNKIESELSSLGDEDAALYLGELGLEKSGLSRLIKSAYDVLGLQSYLTAGEIEVRAWTVKKGATAPEAAGVIHTDFEKKFIKAKVTSYEDFVAEGGWKGVKENGKLRLEGRDYVMQEGDIVEFMIGS